MSVPKIVMPLCSLCRRVSVTDPCRYCVVTATAEQVCEIEPELPALFNDPEK